jgi:hypothetical protein
MGGSAIEEEEFTPNNSFKSEKFHYRIIRITATGCFNFYPTPKQEYDACRLSATGSVRDCWGTSYIVVFTRCY